ncbi:hypothetical protein [Sphingosinicella sp.]|uniref:hypothetical protein n=1 Tax=Sphingosinicella sp. TaxID=1917971 RepID=UPI0040382D6E
MFTFQPRWKEELVVTGPNGSFLLELPMGILTVYLPTEEAWRRRAPAWARDLWPVLHAELREWCKEAHAQLKIKDDAWIEPIVDQA